MDKYTVTVFIKGRRNITVKGCVLLGAKRLILYHKKYNSRFNGFFVQRQ